MMRLACACGLRRNTVGRTHSSRTTASSPVCLTRRPNPAASSPTVPATRESDWSRTPSHPLTGSNTARLSAYPLSVLTDTTPSSPCGARSRLTRMLTASAGCVPSLRHTCQINSTNVGNASRFTTTCSTSDNTFQSMNHTIQAKEAR